MCNYIRHIEQKHINGDALTLQDTGPLHTFSWLLSEEDQARRIKLTSIGLKNIKTSCESESREADFRSAVALAPISRYDAPRMTAAEVCGGEPTLGNAEGASQKEREHLVNQVGAYFLDKGHKKDRKNKVRA